MSFHDRVFLRSASGAKAGVLLCFLLRFRGARARCRLELFSLRVCHVIDRQVSAFRLVFVLFLFLFFSPSLRHAGLVQVIRNLFCLVLGSCRFGRPLSVSGLPYGRFRIPSGAFCPFFSVLCSFPLCRGSLRSSRPQPAVPRLSFAPFPAGSVPDFGYAVIPLPTENEILSGFETVRFGLQRKASRPPVRACRERGFFRRDIVRLCVGPACPCPLAYGLEQHDGRCG